MSPTFIDMWSIEWLEAALLKGLSERQKSMGSEKAQEPLVGSLANVYDVSKDAYEGLRDTTTGILPTDSYFTWQSFSPTLMVKGRSFGYNTALIEHLANDVGATVVTVDADDLYGLACEFTLQERGVKFEDERPEIVQDGRYNRTKDAIQAILNVQRQHHGTTSLDGSQRPLIVHIRDVSRFAQGNHGPRVLKQFRFWVQEFRKNNQHIALIGSLFADAESHSIIPMKLGYEPSVFEFNFRSSVPSQCTTIGLNDSEWKRILLERQIRHLKANIRFLLPVGFGSALLTNDNPLDLSEFLQDGVLPPYNVPRAALQFVGVVRRKGILQLSDINPVLARMINQSQEEKEKSEAKELGAKESEAKESENAASVEEEQSISDRLEIIRSSCNRFETKLFTCVVDPGTQKVSYDDVVMEDSAKETVKHLVYLSRQQFESSSQVLMEATRITGALFYGPPGTGKTQLARAIANDTHAAMITISPADIESKWVGETENYIQATFSLARKLSPCVIFIDEVDALFYRRSSHDASWRRQALTQYLQEMDGLSSSKDSPFVIGATNKPLDLDEAFLRRMPFKIQFDLPTADERRKILDRFLTPSDLDTSFDMGQLIKSTKGCSGSDLRSLCGQAALKFGIENVPRSEDVNEDTTLAPIKIQLTNHHFAEALQRQGSSVSDRSRNDIRIFNQMFNPQALKGPADEQSDSGGPDYTPQTPQSETAS
ncbi:P-loop containing nucleoside triphosphate hydrolase protein [Aspergillus avenaceus]|uniref:P-loop containing nucleoside triphosphate hydrolase protein n=1 Tax=Aspergillus avenaceus TaxID=36643 RepID=A0A5N6U1T7_ASPAV|nr:P-loop containing nucleoside triphosphate hydrolase protein [Aspergillus avenaceus]